MLSRTGLILLGLLFVACCAGGVYVAFSGRGWIVGIVEGIRAPFFGLLGGYFIIVAVRSDDSTAGSLLRDFLGGVFSRRNLSEFAAVIATALAGVAVMLLFFRG